MSKLSIQTITAFVAVDDNGDEGVMGAMLGETFYPLVCADEERIASMFPLAEQIKQASGLAYRVVQFSGRIDVTDLIVEKYKNK